MPEVLTPKELGEMLDWRSHATINKWLARGDGAAVYRNENISPMPDSHPEYKTVSFGSTAAMLEVDVPPQTLPDIGGQINWRYQLFGTCRGAEIPEDLTDSMRHEELKRFPYKSR